jgi:D-alanine-D-alanine ligase
MKIGLSFDLKESVPLSQGEPEDALEEYDSLETVDGLTKAIEAEGHSVVRLGGGREFLRRVLDEKVDFVFNISEGLGNYRSREAQVPSVLEMLDIAYSGADPQCLAVCLDKHLTKKIVSLAGIPTPKWFLISSKEQFDTLDWNRLPYPVFIKPAQEGSSKGIRLASRIESPAPAKDMVAKLWEQYHQPVMIEQYISGDEVTVGIVGNPPDSKVIGIMRVLLKSRKKDFVYSLEIKRDWERLVDYECPAKLPSNVLAKIKEYSLQVFEILECRDFGRVDFRISADGTPYFLEINPLAGLNPRSSDLPIMSRLVGITYYELIASILKASLQRYPQCASK